MWTDSKISGCSLWSKHLGLLSRVLKYSEHFSFACYLIKLDNTRHEYNQTKHVQQEEQREKYHSAECGFSALQHKKFSRKSPMYAMR